MFIELNPTFWLLFHIDCKRNIVIENEVKKITLKTQSEK